MSGKLWRREEEKSIWRDECSWRAWQQVFVVAQNSLLAVILALQELHRKPQTKQTTKTQMPAN